MWAHGDPCHCHRLRRAPCPSTGHPTVDDARRPLVDAGSRRNAIPLLVGYIEDAVVGDHRSPRVGHAAVNVDAGTESTRDLTVGLWIPTRVVRTGLTGREDHRGGVRCVVDAHALPGESHTLDLTGRVENP